MPKLLRVIIIVTIIYSSFIIASSDEVTAFSMKTFIEMEMQKLADPCKSNFEFKINYFNEVVFERAWKHLEDNKNRFCISDPRNELVLVSSSIKGNIFTLSFAQVIKGIPLDRGFIILTNSNPDNIYLDHKNIIVPANDIDTAGLLSEDEALAIIRAELKKSNSSIRRLKYSKLKIMSYNSEFRPIWLFDYFESRSMITPDSSISYRMLDAKTGECLVREIYDDKSKMFGGYKLVQNAYEYAVAHKESLGLKDPLTQLKLQRMHIWPGMVVFDVYWKGLKIDNEQIRFYADDCVKILGSTGSISSQVKGVNIEPKISGDKAFEIAFKHFSENVHNKVSHKYASDNIAELCIINKDNKYQLIWKLLLYPKEYREGYYYGVDANSGEVIGYSSTRNY